jgi:hypothetical protein
MAILLVSSCFISGELMAHDNHCRRQCVLSIKNDCEQKCSGLTVMSQPLDLTDELTS